MSVGTHIGVLHHILGLAVVAHDRPCRTVQAPIVAAHDHLEECQIAPAHALDDVLVGEFGRVFSGQKVPEKFPVDG